MNSVPVARKLPNIASKLIIKPNMTSEVPGKRPQISFSVKKTNNIFIQNSTNIAGRNVNNF